MYKIGPWIRLEGCSVRVLEGTDPEVIENRVALIEKTPRVRIRPYRFGTICGVYEDGTPCEERQWSEHLDWAARPYKGEDPDDEESKAWCDAMLTLLGYKF